MRATGRRRGGYGGRASSPAEARAASVRLRFREGVRRAGPTIPVGARRRERGATLRQGHEVILNAR